VTAGRAQHSSPQFTPHRERASGKAVAFTRLESGTGKRFAQKSSVNTGRLPGTDPLVALSRTGAILTYELRAAAVDRIAPRSHTCRGSELSLGCHAMRK
jgi:hypothetical protein